MSDIPRRIAESLKLVRELQPSWMVRDSRLVMNARGAMSAVDGLTQIIIPIYLAQSGWSAAKLGLLFTIITTTDAVFSTIVGLWSDRIGRKVFMVGMPMLTALAGFVFAFTHNEWLIFVSAALGSFGWGTGAIADATGPYTPAEQSWIADATPPAHRNAVFGRMAFAASIGSLLGIQLTRLQPVSQHFGLTGADVFRPLFFACGLLALVAGLMTLPIADRRAPRKVTRNPFHLSRESWPLVLRFSIANSVNGVAVGFFGPFVTYWFYRRYGVTAQQVSLLYSLINISSLVSNLSAAGVARRFGLVRTIALGWGAQVALLVPMVLAPSFWIAGGLYLVRMFIQRLGTPLRRSYLVAVSPPHERGSVAGITGLPMQTAVAFTPSVTGYLFERAALWVPFEIGAFFQGLGCLVFWLFFRNLHPPEEIAVPDDAVPAPVAAGP